MLTNKIYKWVFIIIQLNSKSPYTFLLLNLLFLVHIVKKFKNYRFEVKFKLLDIKTFSKNNLLKIELEIGKKMLSSHDIFCNGIKM